jgi:hypothetical protein
VFFFRATTSIVTNPSGRGNEKTDLWRKFPRAHAVFLTGAS